MNEVLLAFWNALPLFVKIIFITLEIIGIYATISELLFKKKYNF